MKTNKKVVGCFLAVFMLLAVSFASAGAYTVKSSENKDTIEPEYQPSSTQGDEIPKPCGIGDVVDSFDSPGGMPDGLAWDGSYLWNADKGSGKIYKLDPSDGSVVDSFDSPGNMPTGLAWDDDSPGGPYLWNADRWVDKIYKLDPSDGSVVDSFDSPGNGPEGLAWDDDSPGGPYLWNAEWDGEIYKLDPSDGSVVDSFDSPEYYPSGLAWDDDSSGGPYLWNANTWVDKIYKLDPSDGSVVDSFDSPGTCPYGLAWDDDSSGGPYLWNADINEDRIYKIDVIDDPPYACYNWEDADGNGPGTVINFDASCSTDDNGIVSYKWDWTSDGSYDYTDSDPYCSHDYGDTDLHDCMLRVTDTIGQTDTVTHTVHASTPPTVEITYPNEGDTVSGTITITGIASDDSDIDYVQVKIDDGSWQTATGTTSWSYVWDTTQYDDGPHTIYARSYDGEYYSEIDSVTVYVDNNDPPTVEITYPNEGDTVSGTITITGIASDDSDIDYVQVKIDDGSWQTATGTTSWSYEWDTTQYSDDSHTIHARSYDGEYYSEIDSVTVYVYNDGENNPPWFYSEDPPDGATDVPVSTSLLSVVIEDIESDSFGWSIETSPNIGSNSGTSEYNGTKTCGISGLNYETTYTWYVNATDPDGSGQTTSEVYTFTTEEEPNNPPNEPSNPNPPNGATDVPVDAILSWTGGDPDGDPVTYDVYFGTGSSPPLVSEGQSGTTYDPGTMNYETTYYWKIVAWDNQGESTSGPIWSFTTEEEPNNPPNTPQKPDGPTDGRPGESYTYSTSTTDPDGDNVYYWFDWDDGSNSGWIGPYPSGGTGSASHSWSEEGEYNVKVKAKDTYGEESSWSSSLKVTISEEILLFEGFEDGVMPPPGGWTVNNGNTNYPWSIADAENNPVWVHSGDYAAYVFCDYHNPSDNWLVSPDLDLSGYPGVTLKFWVRSHTMFAGTVELHIMGSGFDDVIWDMQQDEDWQFPEYREKTFDLSSYIGETIEIGWRYVSPKNGPIVALDDITVTDPPSNNVPYAPSIDGPLSGEAGVEYDYTFVSTDSDDDDVKYFIDWGNGNTEWTDYYNSGEEVTVSHTWSEQGTYEIKSKAKDIHGAESGWGYLEVMMPINMGATTIPTTPNGQSSTSSQQQSSVAFPSQQNNIGASAVSIPTFYGQGGR